MAENTEERKMLLIITHATDDTERANLALALAASLVSEGYKLTILFMFEGAMLAKKGVIETIEDGTVTPARDLWPIILEANAKLFVCTPCAKKRGLTEEDLIEGIKMITGPTAVSIMPGSQILTL